MDWRFRLRWVVWYQVTRPFRALARLLGRVFTIYRIAFLLALAAVALWHFYQLSIDDLLPNIVTNLFGVALTVYIIDTMYKLRSDSELKKVLIAKLGSKSNPVASEALRELDARGWLSEGTLQRAFLLSSNLDGNSFTGADLRRASFSFASLRDTTWFEADLRGASLDHADLQGAHLSMHAIGPHYAEADLTNATLSHVNLRGASVRHEQLVRLCSLWRAVMPDGQFYDGRYNLPDDIELHLKLALNPHDPQEWAQFYGVPLVQYLQGQAWARANATSANSPIST